MVLVTSQWSTDPETDDRGWVKELTEQPMAFTRTRCRSSLNTLQYADEDVLFVYSEFF